ncbi:MAG: hypothetical protein RLY93_20580 [Sumerlaeia bacterium]
MASSGGEDLRAGFDGLEPGGSALEEDELGAAFRAEILGIGPIAPDFSPDVLDALRVVTLRNPDLANAVGNIVLLGNTEFSIEVEGRGAEALRAAILELNDTIYPFGGGWRGLVSDMLRQVAVYGGIAVEWVPADDLKDLHKGVLVPARSIRFRRDPKTREFYPVQVRKGVVGSLGKDSEIVLNPLTFQYLAAERSDSSPYAIPPLIAALEPLAVQAGMAKQIRFIVRKLGLLGLLEVLVAAPKPKNGEPASAYKERAGTHLRSVVDSLNKMKKDGIVAGFKGSYEFKSTATTSNLQGFQDIWRLNEEQVASGARQDPAMWGRSYSTTETYGRVVQERQLAQLTSYQELVSRALERAFMLIARLRAIEGIDSIEVLMEPANIHDRKEAAEQEKIEIENANALFLQGVIDQDARARRLGYGKAARPQPLGLEAPAAPGGAGEKEVENALARFTSEQNARLLDAICELSAERELEALG